MTSDSFGRRWAVIGAAIILIPLAGGCRRSPQDREAKFLASGKRYLAKDDVTRAAIEFRNAGKAVPTDAEPFYQLALCFLKRDDGRATILALKKALELNPQHIPAKLKLSELAASRGPQESLPNAEQRAAEVLKDNPDNVDALTTLAVIESRLGNVNNAENTLEHALRLAPRNLSSAVALARIKIQAKDLKGAETALQAAARSAPESPAPLVALGDFYSGTGRFAEAEQQFRAALKLNPADGAALLDLARLQAHLRQTAAAERTLAQLSSLPAPAYKALHADYLFSNGESERAVKEYEKLWRDNPQDREARTRLIRAYLSLGRAEAAEKAIADALARNPKDTDALEQRAALYLRGGKRKEAAKDLETVVGFKPESAEAHALLARVYQTGGDPLRARQEWAEALKNDAGLLPARLALAANQLAAGSPQVALDTLEQAPASQRRSPEYIAARNWALFETRDDERLAASIREGLAVSRTPTLLLQAALLKSRQKNFAAARADLEEALKAQPLDTRLIETLLRAYGAEKRNAAGLEWLRGHAARFPRSAPVQQLLGQWLEYAGDFAGARAAFAAAKSADPNFTTADLWMAKLDMHERNFDAARSRLQNAIAREKGNVAAQFILGELDEQTGRYAAAVEDYRQVIALDPNHAMALNNLAYWLAEWAHQPDEALKLAQQAKELAPDNPAVDDTLGWAFYQKGLYSAAIRYFEAGESSKSGFALTNEGRARKAYHLAMACFKAGQQDRARRELQAAVKLDPNLAEANTARALMAQATRN